MRVKCVRELSVALVMSLYTCAHTQVRSLMHARCVRKVSQVVAAFLDTSAHTKVRSHMCVQCVTGLSVAADTLPNTCAHTQVIVRPLVSYAVYLVVLIISVFSCSRFNNKCRPICVNVWSGDFSFLIKFC
jgi:hypothetical protein